ncbi:MAG: hypothetical protein U9R08_01610 [Nanoarchaeota archaeon]|nr:hypothetical protein [Nanoarchaeota archaeon]
MYSKLKKLKKHHQLLYSLLIAIGIVAIWRGVWMLLDLYFFSNNPAISALMSLIIGLLIIFLTHYKLS